MKFPDTKVVVVVDVVVLDLGGRIESQCHVKPNFSRGLVGVLTKKNKLIKC